MNAESSDKKLLAIKTRTASSRLKCRTSEEMTILFLDLMRIKTRKFCSLTSLVTLD